MKLSLKIREELQTPLLKAKLPLTILNLPFLSTITAGDTSDLSFNLSTNFPSFPSLKLSYTPTTTTSNPQPFSLSLKSGIGLFGSPANSPIIISANINLFYASNNSPSFSIQFKPQFGHFSLHKTSVSNNGSEINNGVNSVSENGVIPNGWTNVNLESTGEKNEGFVWKDLNIESTSENIRNWKDKESVWKGKDGILNGVKVRARTELPLTSKLMVNFRWGLNFPAEVGKKMPFLSVNKIGICRVEQAKKEEEKKSVERGSGDVELLKGMYVWMSKDLEVLQKENRELKQSLEEIRVGVSSRKFHVESDFGGNKAMLPVENSSEFDRWRSKKSVAEENSRKEMKKLANDANSLESELQKAIKAASS